MNLIETSQKITADKKAKNVYPTHATLTEISLELGVSVTEIEKEIEKQGLKTERTINSKFIKL